MPVFFKAVFSSERNPECITPIIPAINPPFTKPAERIPSLILVMAVGSPALKKSLDIAFFAPSPKKEATILILMVSFLSLLFVKLKCVFIAGFELSRNPLKNLSAELPTISLSILLNTSFVSSPVKFPTLLANLSILSSLPSNARFSISHTSSSCACS